MQTWPRIEINDDRSSKMCFGCGQDNPIGLKLDFQWDGQTARGEFMPTNLYQGKPGIVHGGIITTILDEAMGSATLSSGRNCLTARMQLKLARPAPIDEMLIIAASVTRQNRKLVKAKAEITLRDGTLIAESTGTMFIIEDRTEDEKQ